MFSAEPVCSCACFCAQIAHETAGAARTRSSLRPLYFERAKRSVKPRAHACREKADSHRSGSWKNEAGILPTSSRAICAIAHQDPGPITPGRSFAEGLCHRCLTETSRGMGPGSRPGRRPDGASPAQGRDDELMCARRPRPTSGLRLAVPGRQRNGGLGRQQQERKCLLKVEADRLVVMAEIADRDILADMQREIAAARR